MALMEVEYSLPLSRAALDAVDFLPEEGVIIPKKHIQLYIENSACTYTATLTYFTKQCCTCKYITTTTYYLLLLLLLHYY